MTEPDEPTDPLVGGRYELGERLGRGGMAVVYRATDTRLGRPVALKQLRSDLATDPTFLARFRREAQSAASLNHPNIVAVYDTGEQYDQVADAPVPYIVMELVEGTTLRDVLRAERRILPERALELTSGVLDALTYSHRSGIVHRDIKPANVMLTPAGDIKVMDFGIARAVADTSATMTQTAAVIGTAQYLSPEQARGETVDERSDLYSAGCVLYELLAGRPPFTGDSPVSVAYQHVREAPTPPNDRDPSIPPEINAIAMKALAKEPSDRYQSAREMKADISRVLAGGQAAATAAAATPGVTDSQGTNGDPTQVVPAAAGAPAAAPVAAAADQPEGSPPRKKRTGLVVSILVVIIVLLGAGSAGAWWYLRGNSPTASSTDRVTVPKVTGMDRGRAKSELKDRDLVAKFTKENGPDDRTVNTTTHQKPKADTRVDKGSTVTVRVNVGPKRGTVPDGLVGMSYDEAKSALTDAGFDSDNIKRNDASQPEPVDSAEDEVLKSDPKEGEHAGLDDQVTLTVATGKSEVPDLRGERQDKAKKDADKAGFDTRIKRVTGNGAPAHTVVDQSRKPGKLVKRGKTITIDVAKKPKSKPNPTVTQTTTATESPPDEPSESPSSSDSPSESASSKPSKSDKDKDDKDKDHKDKDKKDKDKKDKDKKDKDKKDKDHKDKKDKDHKSKKDDDSNA